MRYPGGASRESSFRACQNERDFLVLRPSREGHNGSRLIDRWSLLHFWQRRLQQEVLPELKIEAVRSCPFLAGYK
jgi:hypothetical protein